MRGGLLVAFPGTGFTTKEALFRECISAFQAKGYHIVELDFSMIPFQSIDTVDEAVEAANQQAILQLEAIRFKDYEDVVFISKSLGTVCAGGLEKRLGISPRQLYLTPLNETLPYVDRASRVIAMVLGTADRHMAAERLSAFCAPLRIPCLIVKGVGHSLKAEGDDERTRAIIKEIKGTAIRSDGRSNND